MIIKYQIKELKNPQADTVSSQRRQSNTEKEMVAATVQQQNGE
jgi:hypothetical protein